MCIYICMYIYKHIHMLSYPLYIFVPRKKKCPLKGANNQIICSLYKVHKTFLENYI